MLTHRIASKVSWWKHAWPYRWAHKPLCNRFRADVVHLGRLNLCRSCLSLWLGIVVTTLASLLLTPVPGTILIVLWSLVAIAIVSAHPRVHARGSRALRDVSRATAGASLALCVVAATSGRLMEGALTLLALLVVAWVYRRARAPLRARKCEGCPEQDGPGVCSGFRAQTEASRAHEIAIEERLLRSGFVPDLPGSWQPPTR